MDNARTPFDLGDILPFNKKPMQGGQSELPKLPFDLGQITKPEGLFGKATATYCATQHPELYTYAALGGAGASLAVILVLVGLFAFVGKLVSMLRGRA